MADVSKALDRYREGWIAGRDAAIEAMRVTPFIGIKADVCHAQLDFYARAKDAIRRLTPPEDKP
jgi:hypothetical protein